MCVRLGEETNYKASKECSSQTSCGATSGKNAEGYIDVLQRKVNIMPYF